MTTAVALKLDSWISVAAAKRMLGKSHTQIYRYIDAGKIRTKRVGTLGWKMVSREDVEAMMSEKQHS